jgi:hypothetical protein
MTTSGSRYARRIPVGRVGPGAWWIEVNGDGRVDPVVANESDEESSRVTVLLGKGGFAPAARGDGEGRFTAAGIFPVGGKPAGIALADLDGDGRADLVSADSGRDRLTVRWSRATVAQ